MTSFVTLDQYNLATGQTLTAGTPSGDKVLSALDAASQEIRDYTGQTIDRVNDEVIHVDGTGFRRILLPQLPVINVTEIIVNEGLDSELTVVAGVGDGDYTLGESGVVFRKCGWLLGYRNVKVTYSHGWDAFDIPASLVNVAVQMARTNVSVSPGGIVSETIGGYSYSLGQVTAQGVDQFSKTLAPYKIRRIPVG